VADDNILTRKIGPLPGWAWGAIAVGAGYILLQRFGSASGSQGQQSGLSPAASAIPFVPSVTVTGVPPSASNPPNPLTSNVPQPVWLFGPTPPEGTYIWQVTAQGQAASGGMLPSGPQAGSLTQDILQRTGPYGTQWAKVPTGYTPTSWIQALLGGTSGGQGGFGVPAVTAMMGWTTGWGQSTRTVRYPFGGAGGSPGITDRTPQSNSALYPSPGFALGPRGYGGSSKSAWYPSLGAYGGKSKARSGVRRAQSPIRTIGFGGQNPRTQAGNSRLPGRRPGRVRKVL
jgi:hypothetical protein